MDNSSVSGGAVGSTDDQANQNANNEPTNESLEPTGQDTPNNVNENAPGESKGPVNQNPANSGVATQRDGEVAPQVGAIDHVARRVRLSDLLTAIENAMRSLDGWVNVEGGGDVAELRDHLQAAREWIGGELGLEVDDNGNLVTPRGQTEGARASREAAEAEVDAADRAVRENQDVADVLRDEETRARERASSLGTEPSDSQANAEVNDNPPANQTP